jgi:hypothetical protein
MDPVTIANSLITLLIPIMAKGMEEVATSALQDGYASIREKFSGNPEEKKVVERFEKNPSEGADDFQALLIKHLNEDQELRRQLTEALSNANPSSALVGKVKAKNVAVAKKINKIKMS